MTKRSILIIEDDEAILELIAVRLRASGYEVRMATDAMLGTKMAIQAPPDLILLDLKMPAGGGAGVLQSLRNSRIASSSSILTKRVPVIVVTGASDPESKNTLRQFGIKTYIQKPFTPEELLGAIASVLPASSE